MAAYLNCTTTYTMQYLNATGNSLAAEVSLARQPHAAGGCHVQWTLIKLGLTRPPG